MKKTRIPLMAAVFAVTLILIMIGFMSFSVFGADSWDTSGFNETVDGGVTVWTDKEDQDLKYMNYNGSLANINSIDFDVRYNKARWPEAHNGIFLYSDDNVLWYVNYNSSSKKLSVTRAGATIFSTELDPSPAGDQWMHWQLTWNGRFVNFYIDGESIFRLDTQNYGDVFGTKAKISLYCWGHAFSVKNIELSKIEGLGNNKWLVEGGEKVLEGSEVIYNAFENEDFSKVYYKGSLEGIDSVSYSMRFNKSRWNEASGGVILYTEGGANWYIDYRADVNTFRIRRNDVYMVYDSYKRTIEADEFIDIAVTWNGGAIRLYVEGELLLEKNYSDFGDTFGAKSTMLFNTWGMPWSVKNIKFENIGGIGLKDWDSLGGLTVSDDGKGYVAESDNNVSTLVYKGDYTNALSIKTKFNYSDKGANENGYLAFEVSGYFYKLFLRADGGEALLLPRFPFLIPRENRNGCC